MIKNNCNQPTLLGQVKRLDHLCVLNIFLLEWQITDQGKWTIGTARTLQVALEAVNTIVYHAFIV
jgi:hypothetical protein